jgi:hypothetical protein
MVENNDSTPTISIASDDQGALLSAVDPAQQQTYNL